MKPLPDQKLEFSPAVVQLGALVILLIAGMQYCQLIGTIQADVLSLVTATALLIGGLGPAVSKALKDRVR
jgi:glycopeptide antibiotics resistance protein